MNKTTRLMVWLHSALDFLTVLVILLLVIVRGGLGSSSSDFVFRSEWFGSFLEVALPLGILAVVVLVPVGLVVFLVLGFLNRYDSNSRSVGVFFFVSTVFLAVSWFFIVSGLRY